MTVFLLRRSSGGAVTARPIEVPGAGTGGVRIRCPRCGWEPGKDDRWLCLCGHVWNTFDTGGVCPACAFEWEYTACHRCHAWSRHGEWYAWEERGQRA